MILQVSKPVLVPASNPTRGVPPSAAATVEVARNSAPVVPTAPPHIGSRARFGVGWDGEQEHPNKLTK